MSKRAKKSQPPIQVEVIIEKGNEEQLIEVMADLLLDLTRRRRDTQPQPTNEKRAKKSRNSKARRSR